MARIVLVLAWLGCTAIPAIAQDAAAGERIYRVCLSCHQIGEGARNGLGPHLNGLFERRAGSLPGFNYSLALRQSPIAQAPWSDVGLRKYLGNPRSTLPGTSMTFAGMRSDEDIANVIAYMRSFDAQGRRRPQ